MQKPQCCNDHCYYCERKYGTPYKELIKPLIRTKDHMHPKSKDGLRSTQNILGSCCDICNRTKDDRTPVQFLVWLQTQLRRKNGIKNYPASILQVMIENVKKVIQYSIKVPLTNKEFEKQHYITGYKKIKIASQR